MKSKLPSFSCCKTGCRPPLKTKTALTLDSSPPLLAFDHDMTSAPKKVKKDEKEGLSMCATAALLHGLIVILQSSPSAILSLWDLHPGCEGNPIID